MSVNKVTSKPFDIKDYKAENAEVQRASQENNYIYSLLKKAESGSCSAIKKLLGYSMINFNPDVEFAAKLMEEAKEMLNKAYDIYTDGAGQLSNRSLNAAEHAVVKDDHGCLTQNEKQNKVNTIVDDMESSIK